MGIYDNDIKRDIAAIYALLNGVKPSCELENPLQQIFYGAPGTGKSFEIKCVTMNQSKIRTTFHPDSDYSTFVGCYKPIMSNEGENGGGKKQIEYAFVAQSFFNSSLKFEIMAKQLYVASQRVL
jgi:Cdc6-like AAA superfamily ATPase